MTPARTRLLVLALLATAPGLGMIGPRPAVASYTYEVLVDTSEVPAGTVGYLDFQFNPGGGTAQAASALLSDFTSRGLTFGALQPTGEVSGGALPSGPVAMGNGTVFNEALQAVRFGMASNFRLAVTLSGPAVAAPNPAAVDGTILTVSVLDANFSPLLPAAAPVDPLVQFNIAPGTGVVTYQGTPPEAVVRPAAVPEPNSLASAAIGLVMLARYRRSRRRRAPDAPAWDRFRRDRDARAGARTEPGAD